MCKLKYENYKMFSDKSALEWGKKYYGDYLKRIQSQDNSPSTPAEEFFRYYTQGSHYIFNRVLRSDYDIKNIV